MAQDELDQSGPQQKPVVLTAEAQAAAFDAAVKDVPPDSKVPVNSLSMNRIRQAAASIPFGRLRLMMADGRISAAEARAALAQAGLSPEEIDQAVEYTCRVLENYARHVIAPEHSLAHVQQAIEGKVKKMGGLLASGAILPDIKNQPKDQNLSASTPGQEKIPDGKNIT